MKRSKVKAKNKALRGDSKKSQTGTMKKILETSKRRKTITFPEVRDLG